MKVSELQHIKKAADNVESFANMGAKYGYITRDVANAMVQGAGEVFSVIMQFPVDQPEESEGMPETPDAPDFIPGQTYIPENDVS